MKDEIINATYIREAAKRIDDELIAGYCYWLYDDSDFMNTITAQNELLIKAADRIEELETGLRNLLKKYQGS